MTTGQNSLREVAEASRQEKLEERRKQAQKDMDKSLGVVVDKYHDDYRGFGRLAREGYEVVGPEGVDFEFVRDVRVFTGVNRKTDGWKVVIDEVPFLFGTSYQSESLHVIITCPKCGAEGASTFHGLDDLGKLLKFGPKYGHKCREAEAREVAYAIGSAARDLKCSPQDVVAAAYELHSDLIDRLTYGR
jgi:hypothetical protein